MTTTDPRVATGRGIFAAALAALLIASATTGCVNLEKRSQRRADRAARPNLPGTTWVVLDGQVTDWPSDRAAMADQNYLYFRISLPEEVSLQASPEPVILLVDVDGNGGTGMRLASPRDAGGLGFDLSVQFSPADGRGGVAAEALGADGVRTPVPSADLGIEFGPTHSAAAYEVRLARHAGGTAPESLATALKQPGPAATMTLLLDSAGETVGWSDPETFNKPAASATPPLTDAAAPAKPEGAIRIMSWNVKRGSPMSNAGPFSRVFQVLNPDVILVQEWDNTEAADLQAWFTAVVSGERTWSARTAEGQGVAIIAPHPISGVGPARLVVDDPAGETGQPVRWVAGVVQTPVGDVAASSVHLKCCGGMGGAEDQRRMAEAQVINAAMLEAFGESTATIRLIGGDVNLVGSRQPLDVLRGNLDIDGSLLEPVEALVLGDTSVATWADPTSPFTPGRLDYAVVGDAGLEIVHAFVLDTARLSDAALARMGLDRTDTRASDHRPLVIDVRPR